MSLTMTNMKILASKKGDITSLPDILFTNNVQNKKTFLLEESDEIFEGYGQRNHAFPYRTYQCYTRELNKIDTKVCILENEYLQATFLLEYGGRLWKLIDKKTGQNLLYTNDVIRPSNLAIRNAWFSGGTEWNIGMIGHTPFTMDTIYSSVYRDEKGSDVLRFYEYERVRRVTYQMDFWLNAEDKVLNCRMRIVNQNAEVVPMYWWSNSAVPVYPGGRIVVPASEAFTEKGGVVHKVQIPMVDGTDITKYEEIPNQVDYFFHIPKEKPKYIANLNKDGYGLLHVSTDRLLSRKLFSWGNNDASHRWQEFLTEDAGEYLEIQAGLGKTQYGCIPMAPHTAWEWMEQYGPVKLEKNQINDSFEKLQEHFDDVVRPKADLLEQMLTDTKKMALQHANLLETGSSYGVLANLCRKMQCEPVLSSHLDFCESDVSIQRYRSLIQDNIFPEPDITEKPDSFTMEPFVWNKLKDYCDTDKKNWYSCYLLGLIYLEKQQFPYAAKWMKKSIELKENPWAYHGLAVVHVQMQERKQAVIAMSLGLQMRKEDLSYVKEGFRLLLMEEAYEELLECYETLPEEIQVESRVVFDYMLALKNTGNHVKAYQFLVGNDFVLDDLKECEESLEKLWISLHEMIYNETVSAPHCYHFDALNI